MLKLNPTARNSSEQEYEMACSIGLPSLQTLESPILDQWPDWWTSSLRDSRANPTPLLENVVAKPMSETSGPTPSVLYGKWDHNTFSWKMSEDWLTGLTPIQRKSLGSFPRQGMTRSGVCTALPKRVLHISGGGGGVLPTPAAHQFHSNKGGADSHDPRGYSRRGKERLSLHGMAKTGLWPTPNATDYKGRSTRSLGKERLESDDDLPTRVSKYPTPQAGAQNPAAHNAMSGDFKTKLCEVWGIQTTGQLNPMWVEWLMGLPIGWTDLEPLATESYRQWLENFYGIE